MSLFDREKCARIVERIDKLTPDARPAWGKLNVGEMMCHCNDGLMMATGDRPVVEKSTFFLRHIVKPVIVYLVQMPKDAPTPEGVNPHLGGTKPEDFEKDRRALLATIERFCALSADHAWGRHSAFGRMSRRQWGLLHYKHLDHHLKQFGV